MPDSSDGTGTIAPILIRGYICSVAFRQLLNANATCGVVCRLALSVFPGLFLTRFDESFPTLRSALSPFCSPQKPTGANFQPQSLKGNTKDKDNEPAEHLPFDNALPGVQVEHYDSLFKALRSHNVTGSDIVND